MAAEKEEARKKVTKREGESKKTFRKDAQKMLQNRTFDKTVPKGLKLAENTGKLGENSDNQVPNGLTDVN